VKSFSKKQFYLFSLLTGVLLWAGWPAHGFPFLLLIAFCPLLIIEEYYYQERRNYKAFALFRFAYISALSWNILSTWWIINSSIVGAILAIVLNSMFMALILVLFHYVRIKTNSRTGYAALPILWISFEYFHLNWSGSWPWLTLGNGFANFANCVQWYEYTGVLGGSLWILVSNVVIFNLLKNVWLNKKESGETERIKTTRKSLLAAVSIVVLPLIFSAVALVKYRFYHDAICSDIKKVNVVVVQPNIDPYNEKFSGDFKTQLTKMLQLADTKVDSTTDYLVFPETALTEEIWENNWDNSYSIPALKDYLKKYPRLSIVTGVASVKQYNKGDSIPETARKFTQDEGYYDAYNTAIQVSNNYPLQVYHKCKLVPGVETMPFRKLLAPLADWAFALGGTSGTLGTQKEPSVFYSPDTKTTIGTAICYESIYGEYIGEYVQKGAQLLFIITNDGWWGDTPGYKQHLSYARLRAIETRRCIARSANTGTSAFIDEWGTITQPTGWWQTAVIKASLPIHDNITFYVQHGDYIGWIMCWLTAILLAYTLFMVFKKKLR